MSRGGRIAIGIAAVAFASANVGCEKVKRELLSSDDSADESGDAAPKEPPPRCVLGKTALAIDHNKRGGDLELGEAVRAADAFAIGVIRGVGPDRRASIAEVNARADSLSLVDLGAPHGDTPPPRPFVMGGSLFAAYYPGRTRAVSRPSGVSSSAKAVASSDAVDTLGAALSISIVRVGAGHVEPLVTFPTAKDDSLDFDVASSGAASDAGGVLAWDEDEAKHHRGVIQVAHIPAPGAPNAIVGAPGAGLSTIIADDEDLEAPRLITRTGGYWLLYAARKPDELDPDAGTVAHPNRWLEAVPLDDGGKRAGPSHRLTPATFHVTSFALAHVGSSDADVLVRDEDGGAVAQSGRLLRIRLRDAQFSSPEVVVEADVGRGVPDLLVTHDSPRAPGWLSFVSPLGRARLAPLNASLDVASPPRPEPSLDESRPIAVLAPEGGAERLLILAPTTPSEAIRVAVCSP